MCDNRCMGLQKAYCKYCSNEDKGHYSIFEAVPDASICYCPFCTKQLTPSNAIKDYNHLMNKMVKKAYKTLYEKTDFMEAYRMFGRIIELVEDSIEARFGRLVALLYLSTLRKAYFEEFKELFLLERDAYFSRMRDKAPYVSFFEKVNLAIDEYDRGFRRRIIAHRYFYNADCIKLYLIRIKEIKEIKEMMLAELEPLVQKEKHLKSVDSLYSELKLEISTKENELRRKLIAGDGSSYKLIEFTEKGNPLLAKDEQKAKVNAIYSYHKNLEDDGTSKHLIKNRVYPDNTHFYRWIKVDFVFIIVAFLCVFASLITTALLKEKTDLYWIGFIAMSLFIITDIVLLILRFVWMHKIKSRRHLID